ncbi:MAG: hypothetical protein QXJ97_10275 [Desulfurococcaceae archaeon]
MGIKYICGNCGYTLYEFGRTGSTLGLISPEVIARINKVCPSCGKPLEYPTVSEWRSRIVIKPRLRKW